MTPDPSQTPRRRTLPEPSKQDPHGRGRRPRQAPSITPSTGPSGPVSPNGQSHRPDPGQHAVRPGGTHANGQRQPQVGRPDWSARSDPERRRHGPRTRRRKMGRLGPVERGSGLERMTGVWRPHGPFCQLICEQPDRHVSRLFLLLTKGVEGGVRTFLLICGRGPDTKLRCKTCNSFRTNIS